MKYQIREEARKLGIITEEQIDQVSGYKDSLDNLNNQQQFIS